MKAGGVFIEGVALDISWRDARRSLSELIFDTTRQAIDDTGLGIAGIDSVVLAAHDMADGRSLSSMVTAPAAGAYLRDEIRYGDDGAGAFAAACVRIEAGESERTIVAAWGRASEHDVDAVSRSLFDPAFLRDLGLQELHVSAMNAQRWLIGAGDNAAPHAARARRERSAKANPRALRDGGSRSAPAFPLEEADLPRWADVVCAAVISARPAAVRLRGLGQSSEPYWLGDRKLARAPAVQQACARALAEAKVGPRDIDVFEVDGMTLYDEAIAFEAIGLVEPGLGMRAIAENDRCNPSGGGAAGYCAPAMGLTRIVEATLHLRGTAGPIQVPNSRLALATGSSIVAGQTQTAVVLEGM